MFDWQAFHFLRPLWLLALLPLAALLLVQLRQQSASSAWSKICDNHLLEHLLISQSQQTQSRSPLWLLAIAWLIATLALAGPTWSKLEQPLLRAQEALVIVLDLSRSMDAGDIKPSRLSIGKFKLIDLLKKQKEGQTALLVYAAEPYVVSPLTDDTDTIIAQVPALQTALMPSQGSRGDLALEKAHELLVNAGAAKGKILLITDGIEASPDVMETARTLAHGGTSISVLAIGTNEGAPIPLADGGFLKDKQDAIVIPQLDTAALNELAQAGGGIFQTITHDQQDIDALSHYFASQGDIGNDNEQKKQTSDRWQEQGPWLALLILPFAALAFRKGWISLVFVAILLPPQQSHAASWQDLWFTPDQQASQALQQQDNATAAKLFENTRWQGTAHYHNGDYQHAAEAFAKNNDADSHYNRANALAKAGKLDEAISAYDEALKLAPNNEDAKFNRDLVEKLRQQQQQNSENGQNSNEQNSQKNDAQNQQNSQQQNSQQQNGQQSDNQSDSDDQKQNESKKEGDQSQQTSSAGQDQKQQQESQQSAQKQQQAEQKDDESAQSQQAMTQQDQDKKANEQQQAQTAQAGEVDTAKLENQQAVEQWLRRIPDDPSGLLRRKFVREHRKQQNAAPAPGNEQTW